ncbi:uncharacterized protein AB675_3198 [Cyphellophora attinorum]|uniref:Uncharacterized protein n=1 Tax=Cyphellophora attinorum TaxID=1664694 RepID=A0A0N1HLL9_9EURO|nr:uncharacterized protein AB675_3198 [Phialophora attinorum]KPI37956.1 hypothetical protein AB675_3198 [Phialophora attinorum]
MSASGSHKAVQRVASRELERHFDFDDFLKAHPDAPSKRAKQYPADAGGDSAAATAQRIPDKLAFLLNTAVTKSEVAVDLTSDPPAATLQQNAPEENQTAGAAGPALKTTPPTSNSLAVVEGQPDAETNIENDTSGELDESSSEADDKSTVFTTGKYDVFDMADLQLQQSLQQRPGRPLDYKALLVQLRSRQDGAQQDLDGRLSICIRGDHETEGTASGSGATKTTKGYGRMRSVMPGFQAQLDGSEFDVGIANLRKTSSLDLTWTNNQCFFPTQPWPPGRYSRPPPSNEPGFVGQPVNVSGDSDGFAKSFRLSGDLKIYERPVYTDPDDGTCIFRGVIYMDVNCLASHVGGQDNVASSAFWLLRSKKGMNKLDRERVSYLETYVRDELSDDGYEDLGSMWREFGRYRKAKYRYW